MGATGNWTGNWRWVTSLATCQSDVAQHGTLRRKKKTKDA